MAFGADSGNGDFLAFQRFGVRQLAKEREERRAIEHRHGLQRHSFADSLDHGADTRDEIQLAGYEPG